MKVEMYYMASCPYCKRALALLEKKGVNVTLHDVNSDPKVWDESKKRSGRGTVPQIFIGDFHVGGCDDLMALDRKGELDAHLKGE
ncbi:glutaredoxin 3 [Ignatzschineria sp. RMDPL8A]|uniref:glutaredoxin 3 n=1 Tax=Ignatzschineria sp. RMDPL8A TaxID=2999236 RepID=UPI0016A43ADB|nr:glutaredoxin 3 [Ignatzschineria sp. RMDPL8A]MDG9729168.1 glutaredoxin 3 [Ignatzschineria sp. RMDPL8A]NLD08383.1 glutaredoxin 3 [Xanthomonadaceae bacterium]